MKPRTLSTVVAILSAGILTLNAQDKSAIKPLLPGQRDPFLKERGAPLSAPVVSENVSALMAVFETYVLSEEDGAALLASTPDNTARYRHVSQLVAAGRARLESAQASAAKSGQRVLVESVDFVQIANQFSTPAKREEPVTAGSFTQFPYGDRLEFQPTLSPDGRTCNLNFSFALSRLQGFRPFRAAPESAPQPGSEYEKREILTSLAVRTGEPVLVGTLSRAAALQPAKKELAVAFARILVNTEQPDQAQPPVGTIGYIEHLYSFYSMERAVARDLIVANTKPGAAFNAVQALVEANKAKLEHMVLTAAQSGMRAKSDENFVSNQPGGSTPQSNVGEAPAAREEQKGKLPFVAAFSGKNMGLTIELESAGGSQEALLKGFPLVINVSSIITWRGDAGMLKGPGGNPPIYPETGVQESRRIENVVSCYAGVPVLVGTLNPPRDNGVNERTDSGRVWLVFLRATPVKP